MGTSRKIENQIIMEKKYHPERKNFQLDRLIFFTDAVFAIAITLLIIEIRIPEIPITGTDTDFLNALIKLLPKFVGFLLSFFMIGLYWFIHHNMFGFVVHYTNKLIRLNLIFLLSIVLMPFSTAVYSEYSMSENYIKLVSPFAVYVANICFIGIMNFLLIRYIYNPKNNISEHRPSAEYINYSKKRSLAIPTIFLLSLLLTFIWPDYGRLLLFSIPFVMRYLQPKRKIIAPH